MTFYGDIDDDAVKRFKFELKGTNELIILGSKPGDARAKPDVLTGQTIPQLTE